MALSMVALCWSPVTERPSFSPKSLRMRNKRSSTLASSNTLFGPRPREAQITMEYEYMKIKKKKKKKKEEKR